MEQNQIKNNEVLAAITLALHEYQGYTMHVSVLTLGNADTEWNSKLRTQRQQPEHKF